MEREILGETFKRTFVINGKQYTAVKQWHYLRDGTKYHYIHLYTGVSYRPIKRWAWTEK